MKAKSFTPVCDKVLQRIKHFPADLIDVGESHKTIFFFLTKRLNVKNKKVKFRLTAVRVIWNRIYKGGTFRDKILDLYNMSVQSLFVVAEVTGTRH